MAPRGNPLPAARSILLVLASSRLAAPQEFESIISVPSEEVPCPPYSPECANTWPGTADVGDPCVAECNANPDDNPPTRWCPSEVGGGSAPSTPWGWCPQNPDPGPGPAEVFPGAQWEVREPEQEGMSTALLERAIEYAAGENNLRSHCVSIHRNGYLVAEKVWDRPLQPPSDYNSTTMVFSISKAITSTLVGMAERDGLLSTEGRLPEYGIPQWAGTEQGEITVDMLLRHDSGREYINDIEDIALPQFAPAGTDPSGQTEFSINNRSQQHRPGTYTQYNQMAFQLLERVLRNATGLQVPTLAKQQLWNPLQFESQTFWQETGVVSGIRNGPLLYAGVHTSCRDLARFGTLWMHRGTWGRTAPNGTNTTEEFFTPEFWAKAMSNGPRNARPCECFRSHCACRTLPLHD